MDLAGIAGYCAVIGAFEWARVGRFRVPGACFGDSRAMLASLCVLNKDDMAWVTWLLRHGRARWGAARGADVVKGCSRCVRCEPGLPASSQCRHRGCALHWVRQRATHKYLAFVGAFLLRERLHIEPICARASRGVILAIGPPAAPLVVS